MAAPQDQSTSQPTNANPTTNEILYETWLKIRAFMDRVNQTYLDAGLDQTEADAKAVQWANQIFATPDQADEILHRWEKRERSIRSDLAARDAARQLIAAGATPSEAQDKSELYVKTLDEALDSGADYVGTMAHLQKNLKTLAEEYAARALGRTTELDKYAQNPPVQPPEVKLDLKGILTTEQVFEWLRDQVMRGRWYPVAEYVLSSRGQVVGPMKPEFDMSPEDFRKAMEGSRKEGRVLWRNIAVLVSVPVLVGLIYRALRFLYRYAKKQKKRNVIKIQVNAMSAFPKSASQKRSGKRSAKQTLYHDAAVQLAFQVWKIVYQVFGIQAPVVKGEDDSDISSIEPTSTRSFAVPYMPSQDDLDKKAAELIDKCNAESLAVDVEVTARSGHPQLNVSLKRLNVGSSIPS